MCRGAADSGLCGQQFSCVQKACTQSHGHFAWIGERMRTHGRGSAREQFPISAELKRLIRLKSQIELQLHLPTFACLLSRKDGL